MDRQTDIATTRGPTGRKKFTISTVYLPSKRKHDTRTNNRTAIFAITKIKKKEKNLKGFLLLV